MGGDALAVLEVEVAVDVVAVEEALKNLGDRARLEAIGLIPVERAAVRLFDRIEEAAVVRGDLQRSVARPFDNRRGNRKCVEQAGIVRNRKMRFRAHVVGTPGPSGRRPACCSLHGSLYEAAGVNSKYLTWLRPDY